MRLTTNEDTPQKTDHNTGNYMPYSLWQVCGFFYVPHWIVNIEGLWDGTSGLSSWSEKTRESNHLQM